MKKLTTGQVAQRWGCSDEHVRHLIARGELPAQRIGLTGSRGRWAIAPDDVEQYEQRRTIRESEEQANQTN